MKQLDDMVTTEQVTAEVNAPPCPHNELHFASKYFYVVCAQCGCKWVACTANGDHDLDHGRKGAGIGSARERRFKVQP